MKKYKDLFLFIVFCLTIGLLSSNLSYKASAGDFTICHSTSSYSNPYVANHPDQNGDVSGHDGHDGGVFPADPWGDIIPPFSYDELECPASQSAYTSTSPKDCKSPEKIDGRWRYADKVSVTKNYPGKNWTTEGQAIYNNGCIYEGETPPYHLACVDQKCIEVSGRGVNECSEDVDCVCSTKRWCQPTDSKSGYIAIAVCVDEYPPDDGGKPWETGMDKYCETSQEECDNPKYSCEACQNDPNTYRERLGVCYSWFIDYCGESYGCGWVSDCPEIGDGQRLVFCERKWVCEDTCEPEPTTTTTTKGTGGPGDGLSDGRSDGGSSCPGCTEAPQGEVLGASTGPMKAVLGLSTTSGGESVALQLFQLLGALTSGVTGFALFKKNS